MSGLSVYENTPIGENGKDVFKQVDTWSKCTSTTIDAIPNFKHKLLATINTTNEIWKPIKNDILAFSYDHKTALIGVTAVVLCGGIYKIVKNHNEKLIKKENN